MSAMNLPDRPTWQDRALCNETYDDAFFPLSETPETVNYVNQKYCNLCPVRSECLSNAMQTRSRGIWAGTDSDLRTKLRKVRSRAKCPSCQQKQLVRVPDAQICLCCGISWPIHPR